MVQAKNISDGFPNHTRKCSGNKIFATADAVSNEIDRFLPKEMIRAERGLPVKLDLHHQGLGIQGILCTEYRPC